HQHRGSKCKLQVAFIIIGCLYHIRTICPYGSKATILYGFAFGRKTLFIDDFVVDVKSRCSDVGTELYNFIKAFAKSSGCTALSLHVWEGNDSKIRFLRKERVEASAIRHGRYFLITF
ncbi:MAG: GNAT family N-acetyltransferase, partial [Bacilli bacterium]|nr:GNAT family N-acetyltransferase [Bacilli bacterium]